MIYPVGNSGQQLIFTEAVLQHLVKHQQGRWWRREAGGQLFARIAGSSIVIEEATGPRRTDRRTRHSYHPDRRAEQREILEQHAAGRCFVGDWHSHAESVPRPSERDLESMREMFRRSSHALNGFLLVIIGTTQPPDGLLVAVVTGSEVVELEPQPSAT